MARKTHGMSHRSIGSYISHKPAQPGLPAVASHREKEKKTATGYLSTTRIHPASACSSHSVSAPRRRRRAPRGGVTHFTHFALEITSFTRAPNAPVTFLRFSYLYYHYIETHIDVAHAS